MKKVLVILSLLIVALFLTGCLDYKAYDIPSEDTENSEDLELLNEIAEIERELDLETEEETEVVEEIVLPELTEEEVEEPTNYEDLQSIAVKENEWVRLSVEVSDPDNDEVTYSFSKPLNAEGKWKTNYGDAGEYVVTITATDGKLSSEKKLRLVVDRVNVAPEIKGIKDITVREGETVNFEADVTDPNNDPVTVKTSEPLNNGNFLTDYESAGEYQITVVASDGELDTEKSFRLIVNDVNQLPVISNLVDLTVKEGQLVKVEPEITDLDNDEVTLTISEPVGNDGVWTPAYTEHGEYSVIVTVADGKDVVKRTIKVIVEDVNMAPEFVDVSLRVE
jgi:large repetitive protein